VERRQWETELAACYGRVLRSLIALAGSRESGEDAFHDALAAALAPGAIGRIERVDAWLYVVGVRSLRRSHWRIRFDVSSRTLGASHGPPSTERLEVLEMLGQLSQRQREVVIARFYLDLSFAEIARALGITVGTATTTASQALARLRKAGTEGATWKKAKS
jgi:DNA-directed RNA polymerase specialized sigma24 family protein